MMAQGDRNDDLTPTSHFGGRGLPEIDVEAQKEVVARLRKIGAMKGKAVLTASRGHEVQGKEGRGGELERWYVPKGAKATLIQIRYPDDQVFVSFAQGSVLGRVDVEAFGERLKGVLAPVAKEHERWLKYADLAPLVQQQTEPYKVEYNGEEWVGFTIRKGAVGQVIRTAEWEGPNGEPLALQVEFERGAYLRKPDGSRGPQDKYAKFSYSLGLGEGRAAGSFRAYFSMDKLTVGWKRGMHVPGPNKRRVLVEYKFDTFLQSFDDMAEYNGEQIDFMGYMDTLRDHLGPIEDWAARQRNAWTGLSRSARRGTRGGGGAARQGLGNGTNKRGQARVIPLTTHGFDIKVFPPGRDGHHELAVFYGSNHLPYHKYFRPAGSSMMQLLGQTHPPVDIHTQEPKPPDSILVGRMPSDDLVFPCALGAPLPIDLYVIEEAGTRTCYPLYVKRGDPRPHESMEIKPFRYPPYGGP